MDDYKILVTVEYHAMAETPQEAIERVLSEIGTGNGGLLPHTIQIEMEVK